MREVADELAIRGLVARYAEAVTRDDEKTWADTWSERGVWDVLGVRVEGRAAAVARWRELVADVEFVVQHAPCGHVRVEGDRATGSWQITEHVRFKDGRPLLNLGHYSDEYVREADGWRFAERRFRPLYMGPPDLSAPYLG